MGDYILLVFLAQKYWVIPVSVAMARVSSVVVFGLVFWFLGNHWRADQHRTTFIVRCYWCVELKAPLSPAAEVMNSQSWSCFMWGYAFLLTWGWGGVGYCCLQSCLHGFVNVKWKVAYVCFGSHGHMVALCLFVHCYDWSCQQNRISSVISILPGFADQCLLG